MIQRRSTRPVRVGAVSIGGGLADSEPAPVTIQSMTNTRTADATATLHQIEQLVDAGADLVRVATPTPEDTASLNEIVAHSPVPIIADVHFHFQRALEAIDAGVAKLRLNPGNIADTEQVRAVIAAARSAGVAIRVGVNEGSITDRRDPRQHEADLSRPMVDLMVEKMADYLQVFEEAGFSNLVLSAKSAHPMTTVSVNRAMADRWDWPLHLGVTHAGTAATGSIRTAAALGALLAEGIGETIRISFAGDPVAEVQAARELLACLDLRARRGIELIACPTCGRLQMELEPIIEHVADALKPYQQIHPSLTVAIMGCVVNGPGEADFADVAVCAGKDKAVLYRRGRQIETIPPGRIVQAVLTQVKDLAGLGS
jgi:(E)-4-hydroxy-3-methylbut-2-enyl-diphosphate synthase